MARTKITSEILESIKELSSKGLSNVLIAQSLDIAASTLSINAKAIKAIQEGKKELAEKITQSILDNLDESQDRLFIAKRLNLFSPQIDIKKPTTAKEALNNLSIAMKQYADGSINESQLRTIEAVSNSYIKACDFIEFEERLNKLEEGMKK